MAIDYCTAAEAFAYGNSAGTATDPVNEATVMAAVVTEVSRAIDRYCGQLFSPAIYADQILRGVVDRDGVLTCYPPVPTMSAPSAADYRAGNSATWQSIATSALDVQEASWGCAVRVLGVDLSALRFTRTQVRLTYTGGYADLASIPEDLRWAARALAWYEYKRREAPTDRTAIPELGVVIVPGSWPQNIRNTLNRFRKVAAS